MLLGLVQIKVRLAAAVALKLCVTRLEPRGAEQKLGKALLGRWRPFPPPTEDHPADGSISPEVVLNDFQLLFQLHFYERLFRKKKKIFMKVFLLHLRLGSEKQRGDVRSSGKRRG